MARRKNVEVDLSEITEQLLEGLKSQASRPNLYGYKPHAKQLIFHQSLKHTRLYIGGNRAGKTVAGAIEACYWIRKNHPYRRLPLPEGPIRGRAVSVDFNYGVDILMLPEIARWLPPSDLKNGSWEESYNNEHRLLTLANKSTLEFRTYEQALEKHAGTSRHFCWFDEEPPKAIYDENMLRLLDTNGFNWITMTPVEGFTWTHDTLYEKGLDHADGDIEVIQIDTGENPHLSKVAIERVMGALEPEERRAREQGEYLSVGGKIFKSFREDLHVIPFFIPPKSWEWYVSIDHGYNNPTAHMWHAVSPQDKIVTFAEHYEREMVIADHAKAFHKMVKEFGKEPDFIVGDPAMNQRSGHTGTSVKQEYADHGIYIADANNDVLSGIDRMQKYLRYKGDGLVNAEFYPESPAWRITDNCVEFIKEMKKLRWATFSSKKVQFLNNRQEKVHKKDDHACDSTRYFFSFMPDLTPSEVKEDNTAAMEQHASVIGAVAGSEPGADKWDEFIKMKPSRTDWTEVVAGDLYN